MLFVSDGPLFRNTNSLKNVGLKAHLSDGPLSNKTTAHCSKGKFLQKYMSGFSVQVGIFLTIGGFQANCIALLRVSSTNNRASFISSVMFYIGMNIYISKSVSYILFSKKTTAALKLFHLFSSSLASYLYAHHSFWL